MKSARSREAAGNPARRESIIPSCATGDVAPYENVSPSKVALLAVRHQRDEFTH